MLKKLSAEGEKSTGYRVDSAKSFYFLGWCLTATNCLIVFLNFSFEGRLCSCQLLYEDNTERIKDAFIWVTPESVRGDFKIDEMTKWERRQDETMKWTNFWRIVQEFSSSLCRGVVGISTSLPTSNSTSNSKYKQMLINKEKQLTDTTPMRSFSFGSVERKNCHFAFVLAR